MDNSTQAERYTRTSTGLRFSRYNVRSRRHPAAAVLALLSVSLLILQPAEVPPAEAKTVNASADAVPVRVMVRVVTIGRNYELEVQLIDKPAGASDKLTEGVNYHLRYPTKRSKLRTKDPVMFAALNSLRTEDVAEVELLVDADTSSRKCVTTGTGTLCSGGSTTTTFDLVSVGAPQGSCLRGAKQHISHDIRDWHPRPVLCLRRTGTSTTVAGFVTSMSGEAINSVAITLTARDKKVVAVSSVPGDIEWVDLGRLVPGGRYWLAGCVDVKDDGKDCKPGKPASVRYRGR